MSRVKTGLGQVVWGVMIWGVLAGQGLAQQRVNPAYADIEEQAGLPRVLLIGDSISIGYTLGVRQELKGVANVLRPKTNCASTKTGVAELKKWLGDEKWDVIHFNFGLHDVKYVVGDKADIVPVTTAGAHRQIALAAYRSNLEEIVQQLKQTGATLVWCSTTPVAAKTTGRRTEDVIEYNAVALEIMEANDIAVDDLYAFALERLSEIQRPRNVHFTAEGSAILAKRVAEVIREKL